MHSKVVVVLLATMVVLVASKSHFLKKRGQEQCGDDIIACAALLEAYQMEIAQAGDAGEFLRSASIRDHCSRINEITRCAHTTLNGNCRGVFQQPELGMINNVLGLLDYVCIEELDGFARNEQCFTDAAFDDEAAECQPNLENCDVSGFNRCATRAMSHTASCNDESQRLFTGLITKLVRIIPGCKARRHLQKMFEVMMYLK